MDTRSVAFRRSRPSDPRSGRRRCGSGAGRFHSRTRRRDATDQGWRCTQIGESPYLESSSVGTITGMKVPTIIIVPTTTLVTPVSARINRMDSAIRSCPGIKSRCPLASAFLIKIPLHGMPTATGSRLKHAHQDSEWTANDSATTFRAADVFGRGACDGLFLGGETGSDIGADVVRLSIRRCTS